MQQQQILRAPADALGLLRSICSKMDAARGLQRCRSQLVNQTPSTTGRVASAWPSCCARGQVAVFASANTKLKTAKGASTIKQTVRGSSISGRQQQKSVKGGTTKGAQQADATQKAKGGRGYFNFTGFPFPLGPFFERQTICNEVIKGTIWTFDQTQALDFFDVYTPVRMTVIKLKSGGLWVHAPVAPTDECIRLIKELGAPVEYIVLPTFAYEHKIFVGPFSRRFPKAKVYVTPFQWSFPLNLPPQFFGIFPAGELRGDDDSTPWADEIQQKLFLPPSVAVSDKVRLCEASFFHSASRTLVVTDAVVYVPEDPPEIIPLKSLLEIARDGWLSRLVAGGLSRAEVESLARKGPAEDSVASRRRGWARMALLVLYFGPSNLLQPEASFDAIKNRLFVGPVVETLVYSKVPKAVTQWVDSICADWAFQRIIPCHFAAPVRAGPAEFKRAFAFAYDAVREREARRQPQQQQQQRGGLLGLLRSLGGGAAREPVLTRPVVFPPEDLKTLVSLNEALLKTGAVKADVE